MPYRSVPCDGMVTRGATPASKEIDDVMCAPIAYKCCWHIGLYVMNANHICMEGISFQAKVLGTNQITIPVETRDFADVEAGDTLNVVIVGIKKCRE